MFILKLIAIIVVRCTNDGTFKFKPLNNIIVDYLIGRVQRKKATDAETLKLHEYIKSFKLTPEQVTKIIKADVEHDLMQEILRDYELDEELQVMLTKQNNTLLLETYLAPVGYLEPKRRFSKKAEFIYISNMIKGHSKMGIELFKAYIDCNKRTILNDELLEIVVSRIQQSIENQHIDILAAKYLLSKSYMTEAQEIYLLKKLPMEFIKEYIESKQFYQENSQALLVELYYELAKFHQEEYGLRPKALNAYHAKRKEELQLLHPESTVP